LDTASSPNDWSYHGWMCKFFSWEFVTFLHSSPLSSLNLYSLKEHPIDFLSSISLSWFYVQLMTCYTLAIKCFQLHNNDNSTIDGKHLFQNKCTIKIRMATFWDGKQDHINRSNYKLLQLSYKTIHHMKFLQKLVARPQAKSSLFLSK